MTQKELLYYQDAINHEQCTIDICKQIINNLKDNDLVDFMKKELDIHSSIKERLLKVMEECSNE